MGQLEVQNNLSAENVGRFLYWVGVSVAFSARCWYSVGSFASPIDKRGEAPLAALALPPTSSKDDNECEQRNEPQQLASELAPTIYHIRESWSDKRTVSNRFALMMYTSVRSFD